MKKNVTILLSLALAIGLIGCGSDSDESKDVSFERTKTLKTLEREAKFLVNDEGKALYIFDKDSLDKSNCDATCQENWPLFLGVDKNKDINIVSNSEDGHLAYRKHPLYFFQNDKSVGDINGNNIKNVWHLVFPYKLKEGNDVKLSTNAIKQTYLTDANGIALYILDEDIKDSGISNCYGECESAWPVFYSDALGTLPEGTTIEDFATIERDATQAKAGEPLKQTTYKGKPLYYYTPELQSSGDTRCDWGDGIWHLVEIVK